MEFEYIQFAEVPEPQPEDFVSFDAFMAVNDAFVDYRDRLAEYEFERETERKANEFYGDGPRPDFYENCPEWAR